MRLLRALAGRPAQAAALVASAALSSCVPSEQNAVSPPIWLAVWCLSALSVAALAWALWRMPRWLPRFAARELVLIALFSSLAFIVVSIPYAFVDGLLFLFAGPFLFLVDGLLFKLLLFLLLGVLFALAPRPGVYLLFYLVWTLFQAVLNGHYSPPVVLFAGAAAVTVEAGLWLCGLTRGRPENGGGRALRRWHRRAFTALLLGACEAAVIFWHLQLIKVIYRQYLADWYVALQALSGGAYAALGALLGLSLGLRLRAMQRPPLPGFAGGTAFPGGTAFVAPPPVPGAPVLELRALSYRYPGAAEPALRDVSFRVEPGELVLLTGPSGCGKTTLLRAIQGLLPVDGADAIQLEGRNASEFPPATWARRCGLLFQEPALQMLRRTPRQDVAFTLELTHVAGGSVPAESGGAVDTALTEFGLVALADRDLRNLSGGELQLAALAGLWAGSPKLLLLDEPLANLDARERPRLMERLRDLAARGIAILIAEHRLEPGARVATRVIRLEDGAVVADGPPGAARPAAMGRSLPILAHDPVVHGVAWMAPRASHSQVEPAPLVELRDLSFRHRGASEPLLCAVDATVHGGQAILLTGENGAGKSTLLELIAGRLRPRQGRVERGGGVGYLPQQADRILQAPTVAEEIAFALRIRRVPRLERERRAAQWLARLGLSAAAQRFPHLLSRGERQRLALGAVMIAEPELLLLDEPFAGQDAVQVAAILALCRAFLDESSGRALVVATHDVDAVGGFFDTRWTLERGALSVEREALGVEHEVQQLLRATGGAG